jgi:hypothetical protein
MVPRRGKETVVYEFGQPQSIEAMAGPQAARRNAVSGV